ncbi:MAG: GWxTD domain-containing protein [bacterium]
MFAVGLLLLAVLPVQGNLPMTLDQAAFATPGAGMELELSYDIPHTSLAFRRTDTGYTAGFRLGLDLLDGRGNPVGSEFRERRLTVEEYDLTVDRQASLVGVVTVGIPENARRVRLQVADLGSQRRATAGFALVEGGTGLRLQFLKRGAASPARVYELGESLEVRARVLEPGRPDSIRFVVRDGRRVVLSRAVATTDSGGRASARLAEPLADSLGVARFPGGEYLLEATGVGGPARLQAQAGFRFRVPFYYDEQAWRDKVDRLLWVASAEQLRGLRGLPPGERESAWRGFWREVDPTVSPGRTDPEDQYFERIAYAEQHFGRGDRGYRSDRARVYVKLGAPDQREVRPFELDSHALEVWNYYSLNLRFVFVDRYGFGEYVLDSPRSYP